jgi:large subunit ribosomal protein L29
MKGLKATEIRTWTEDQLKKQIQDNESRLVALQFQKTIGQLENFAQFETLRRDIARMKTVLTERTSASANAPTTK